MPTITPIEQDTLMAFVSDHEQVDSFRKGGYWKDEEQKGCSVGCLLHSIAPKANAGDHCLLADHLGLDRRLIYLQDALFEALPLEQAKKWTRRFCEARPAAMKNPLAVDHFLHWLLSGEDSPIQHGLGKDEKVDKAVAAVSDLFQRRIEGDEPTRKKWRSATSAADAASRASESAAYAAACENTAAASNARTSARASARAAAHAAARVTISAAHAAYAARASASASASDTAIRAAYAAAFTIADKLIACMKGAS